MTPDSIAPSEHVLFCLRVYKFYRAMVRMQEAKPDQASDQEAARQKPDPQLSLGGSLFWAGELDAIGNALVVAANIAGAATLTASADPAAQRQAVRDGVVDFLVTSLDEALRILKNEIRKRAAVAVCVGMAPSELLREMNERGVRPDAVRDAVTTLAADRGESHPTAGGEVLLLWSVESAPAQALPKLDALAVECLDPQDAVSRRWLQLAGRYLGRLCGNTHVVAADRMAAERMMALIRQHVESGEIKVRGRVELQSIVGSEDFAFGPNAAQAD